MRRSSVIALILAGLLLLGLGFLYVRSFDTDAPPMSTKVAADILNRGKAALERRDVNGLMALVAPEARLLNRNPEQMRAVLNQVMAEMGREQITITWDGLEAKQEGDTAFVSFDLTVGQQTDIIGAIYYTAHIRLELTKARTPHWFGLYSTEEWKVSLAQSDQSLDVPIP